MRLSPEQIDIILNTVHAQAGADARVVLFGSRTDEKKQGGDIDLLIESSPALGLMQRARIKHLLETALGIPVDIVAKSTGAPPRPFQAIALATGISL